SETRFSFREERRRRQLPGVAGASRAQRGGAKHAFPFREERRRRRIRAPCASEQSRKTADPEGGPDRPWELQSSRTKSCAWGSTRLGLTYPAAWQSRAARFGGHVRP